MTKNLIDKKIKKNFRNRPLEEDQMTFQDLNVYRKNEIQDNHLKDSKKVFGEMPIFSDIEFSICGLCNRTCVFCPRANPKVYPNKKEYLSIKLFSKIINELVKYNYSGLMSFSGFSEPFMHKKLFELVKIAKNKLPNCKLEITTNGDILNVSKIRALYKLKLNSILVSMYDGPHQITYFEKMIKQAKEFMDMGINAFRLSYDNMDIQNGGLFEPRESIANSSEWLIKAREELGNQAIMGVDYHHRLSVSETASFCQMMPSHTLDFLEEPIRDETPEAYEVLRTLTDVPFAIGEEFASKWQFLPYIERGITNFARVDICNVGGFTESMKVAGWCEPHYIDLMPHNPLGPICTAASVHLGAAVPNFAWLEVAMARALSPDFDIFPEQVLLEGNGYQVSDKPGLGVEVDESKLTEPFKFWEAPHPHRSDGSHTNW